MSGNRLLPPSPCENCPKGPSSVCYRGVHLDPDTGGCKAWTDWFMENWPKVCQNLARRLQDPSLRKKNSGR